jgi:hypothetical protein
MIIGDERGDSERERGESKMTDDLTDTKEEKDDRRSRLYKDSNTE